MRWAAAALVLLLAAGGAAAFQLLRPPPLVYGSALEPPAVTVPGSAPALPWPGAGSAAVAVDGLGLLGTSGQAAPTPMYSTAKLMTALLVLRDHPLPPGEPGPSLTVSPADAARTAAEAAAGASTVPVEAGELLNEDQLLEGLLIPSGNNFAEMLASWDAGSVPTFVAAMNAEAGALRLTTTHFADPAGFDEATVSTPVDLISLARAALRDPLLGDIVGLASADLPVAGTVYNVDSVLGSHGIAGIKTGSSPSGTASFAGLGLRTAAGGREAVIYTAVMGQPDLDAAFRATERLIDAVAGGVVAWAPSGAAIYKAPWGDSAGVLGTENLALAWPGMTGRLRYRLRALAVPAPAGSVAGSLTVTLGERTYMLDLVTIASLQAPGRRWRLTRPLAGT